MVAQEVKSLADAAAKAAEGISVKLATINTSVAAIVHNTTIVERSVERVSASCDQINESLDKQSLVASSIADAVTQTARGSESVSQTSARLTAEMSSFTTDLADAEQVVLEIEASMADFERAGHDFIASVDAS